MNLPSKSSISKLAALGLLLGISSQALSDRGFMQLSDEPQSTTVKVSDIDLSNPSDVRRLYKRIRIAASRVCGYDQSRLDKRRVQNRRACIVTAIDNAVDSANTPVLTALHRGETERVAGL